MATAGPPLISLASGCLPEFDGPAIVRAAVEAGYAAVGLTIDPDRWTDLTTREVEALLANSSVSVLDVEVVIIQPESAHHRTSERIIDLGARLGAANVLVVSNCDLEETKRAFEQLCMLAERAGLRAALEFMMIFAINSLDAALEVVRDVAHPAGGVLVDALHLERCSARPEDLAGIDPALLPYAQLCDGPRQVARATPDRYLEDALDPRLAPGEGELPLRDLLRALPDGIPLSLEVRSARYRDAYPEPAARARAIREQTEYFLNQKHYAEA